MIPKSSVSLITTLIELTEMVEKLTGIHDKETLRHITDYLLREFIDYLKDDEAWQYLLQNIAIECQENKEGKES